MQANGTLTLGITMFKTETIHAVKIDWRTGRLRSANIMPHMMMDISTTLTRQPGKGRGQVPFGPQTF
ncbi:hypothetical protein SBDP1_150023 [Syntrophobacter sp. SbD1]|nr:hypothetical protein SBDP1_150023 [Syntrophobacter sp. SbD1]